MAFSFCTDNQLRITAWGEELAGLTGKKTSEVRGRKYFEVMPRIFFEDRDALSVVLDRNNAFTLKGYSFHCLIDHLTADMRISPVRARGKVRGVRVAFSGILPCSIALSLRNSKRFIDIGKTASTLAHGVRNPLNAIKGAVVYLSEKYANEPSLVEFAKIMNEEITRLDNFISMFLSTSISDSGFMLTDLNSLLKRVETFTSLQAHTSRIKPVYEFGDIPLVMINSFQIEQAVLNVINNAMAAMRPGGKLDVKTQTETLSGKEFVVIMITDTGSGIGKMAMAEPFVTTGSGGRGFGLFITREILRYHDGHLRIRSSKDSGTSVRLFLPVKREGSERNV